MLKGDKSIKFPAEIIPTAVFGVMPPLLMIEALKNEIVTALEQIQASLEKIGGGGCNPCEKVVLHRRGCFMEGSMESNEKRRALKQNVSQSTDCS